MMKKKSIKLSNGKEWESKKKAIEYFKKILNRYTNNQALIDKDYSDVCALFARYDEIINENYNNGIKKITKIIVKNVKKTTR